MVWLLPCGDLFLQCGLLLAFALANRSAGVLALVFALHAVAANLQAFARFGIGHGVVDMDELERVGHAAGSV